MNKKEQIVLGIIAIIIMSMFSVIMIGVSFLINSAITNFIYATMITFDLNKYDALHMAIIYLSVSIIAFVIGICATSLWNKFVNWREGKNGSN